MSSKRSGTPSFKPPPAKVGKADKKCILCNESCEEAQNPMSEESWAKFRSTAEKWIGLDRFESVYETVDWATGDINKVWHKKCHLYLTGKRKIEQALAKRKSQVPKIDRDEETAHSNNNADVDERPSTRGKTGIIYKPDLCIWKWISN